MSHEAVIPPTCSVLMGLALLAPLREKQNPDEMPRFLPDD
jgi:hypothetical protein